MSDLYAGLLGSLTGIPELPGAACRGEHALFESTNPYDIDDAEAICARCPALDAGEQWYATLPKRQRPTECVIAGQLRPDPKKQKENAA
jgi:hypothetical protein